MTDYDNTVVQVVIEACAAGHVHLVLVETAGGDNGLQGIFTPKEAYDLAMLLMRCAYEADSVLRKMSGADEDVGPCTRH